jgi:NADP-dependent 3-hydroxy acid dehydrogenase YdfG
MAESLDGTVALVTGASSGIGEATARDLAGRGASVALVARRKDRLDALVAAIEAEGGTALGIPADITEEPAARNAVEQAVETFGRLDTVVNNAGVMLLGPALDAPLEEWDRMVAINLQGLLYVTHAAMHHLVAAAAGDPRHVADLVNVSSVAGRRASSGSAVYNLTKHGVGAFAEAMRQELSSHDVRVSLIEPGATATELTDHLRPEIRDALRGSGDFPQRLEAQDIADAIAYIVTRPSHVAVNEVLIRPTRQER